MIPIEKHDDQSVEVNNLEANQNNTLKTDPDKVSTEAEKANEQAVEGEDIKSAKLTHLKDMTSLEYFWEHQQQVVVRSTSNNYLGKCKGSCSFGKG